MDVVIISPNSIKIKTKRSALVVDPNQTLKTKTPADCILLLNKNFKYSDSKLEGVRIIISGTGEYEIEGVKITGYGLSENTSYLIRADNLEVLLTKASLLKKVQEILKECQVVIIDADSNFEQATIIEFSPSIVIVYGEKAGEVVGVLNGKEINKTDKVQFLREKLPEEMQVFLLEQ